MATKKKDTTKKSDAAVKAHANKGNTSVKKDAKPKAEKKTPAPKRAAKPDAKEPVKKTPEPVKASPFPDLPDAKLAGPPFKFDKNNHCENPRIKTVLLGDGNKGVAMHLAVCERDGHYFHNFRLDVAPAKGDAATYGTLLPFGGSGNTFGVKNESAAFYEGARSAYDKALEHPDQFKPWMKDLEDAVAKLQPGILKMAANESMLTVYDPKRAEEYGVALQNHVTLHHSGLILAVEMDGDTYVAVGGGLDHYGQRLKWMRGDWYIYGMANHKKQLETLLTDEQRQTIENEAVVCRAFALDERREHLSFSHHAEVAGIKSKPARAKWLDKAEENAWSVKKLRTEIAAAKAPPELTNGSEKGAGGHDGGAGTEKLPGTDENTPGDGGVPSGDQLPAGDGNGSGDGASKGKSEYADEDNGGATDEKPKSQAIIDNEAHDKLMEHLDAAQTLIRTGLLKSPHVSASKVRGIKALIAKLMEDANSGK